MFDRRLIHNFDWFLLILSVALCAVGEIAIYSAVSADAAAHYHGLYTRQLLWYAVGFIVMISFFLFDYKLLDQHALLIYIGFVLLLVGVLIFGKSVGGSKRWLSLGIFNFQPSETAKIAVIIMLARQYSKQARFNGLTLLDLTIPVIIVLVPFVLIIKQPDLGTALVIAIIAVSMTIFCKIEIRSLLVLILLGAVAFPMAWHYVLKDYQRQRVLTFLEPNQDVLGAGYHILQSKIAIGSGMLAGKGYLKGTQKSLSFLPEQHTDFIFSVIAEEWGFVGACSLILLLFLFLFWGLNIAHGCRDPFGIFMAVGIVAMLFWEIIINIGMVMGLVPVVGMPLPFISYGGSSVLTVMICVGLLLNIRMRRFMFE